MSPSGERASQPCSPTIQADNDDEPADEPERARRPRKRGRSRERKARPRWCMDCDVEIPADTTACRVCGKLVDYVDPDSPEALVRQEKEVKKKVDRLRFYRLDLIALQMLAMVVAGVGAFCCLPVFAENRTTPD